METMWNVIVDIGYGWGLGICIIIATCIATKSYERAKRSDYNIKRCVLEAKQIDTKIYGEK